jgi:hypothetical protein
MMREQSRRPASECRTSPPGAPDARRGRFPDRGRQGQPTRAPGCDYDPAGRHAPFVFVRERTPCGPGRCRKLRSGTYWLSCASRSSASLANRSYHSARSRMMRLECASDASPAGASAACSFGVSCTIELIAISSHVRSRRTQSTLFPAVARC